MAVHSTIQIQIYYQIPSLKKQAPVYLSNPVIAIQQKLSKLQFSIIEHNRIMTLQFPFFTTFYLSSSWFPQSSPIGFIILQVQLQVLSHTYHSGCTKTKRLRTLIKNGSGSFIRDQVVNGLKKH